MNQKIHGLIDTLLKELCCDIATFMTITNLRDNQVKDVEKIKIETLIRCLDRVGYSIFFCKNENEIELNRQKLPWQLRELRMKENLNTVQVAEKLNSYQPVIGRLEKLKINMRMTTLINYLSVLGYKLRLKKVSDITHRRLALIGEWNRGNDHAIGN